MSITIAPDKVKLMQEQKLQELLQHISQNSPFYKEMFAQHQIDVDCY
jgi:phenylacetate-CoA ligase